MQCPVHNQSRITRCIKRILWTCYQETKMKQHGSRPASGSELGVSRKETYNICFSMFKKIGKIPWK